MRLNFAKRYRVNSRKTQHGSQYINKYLAICYDLTEPVIQLRNLKILQHAMLFHLQFIRISLVFLDVKFHWTDNQSQRINRKPKLQKFLCNRSCKIRAAMPI